MFGRHSMAFITIMALAVGLAMDAVAVSIVSGSTCRELKLKHALQIALSFGGFQALMPLVGALAGLSMKKYFAGYDHWVAFALLSAVGGKMLYESFKIGPNDKNLNPTNVLVLLILSVATSIDALAVGFTLSILVRSIAVAVTVIGLTTFVLSYIGVFVGKKFGHLFESKIEAAGGLILIGLGVKIVLEHTLL